ncbi:tRNA pseudouridine(55) synthase TruB [Bacillaceae bacterium SIJ1]|uniref:tRNA pseudouridine(55) synthase TruB n=1 Tax=Litoribacterium kuwaitense TaxID=1398745 RepID=UPI0013ED88B6|nr:tRNA pseudouridine(55) synthase TruB [Litoribacterium kuwaitense]NGP44086.1 tRNA pseudouridine(55) synthase TruB [Litoribacterium kuwaitense]
MDGILLLHKPAGITSRQCVSKVQRLLQTKKAGHTGTLDPGVTGVLTICLGKATKVVEYLTESDKAYQAVIALGTSTTTEDAEGEIVEKVELTKSQVNEMNIMSTLERFKGSMTQIPPLYSAVKVKGKRLYEYARQGIEVERPKRNIVIKDIELVEPLYDKDGQWMFTIDVTCSKGTYIRTLATDIGRALGVPAHMHSLIRTRSGPFLLQDCVTFATIEKGDYELTPLTKALEAWPVFVPSANLAEKIRNGAVLSKDLLPSFQERLIVEAESQEWIAIYRHHSEKEGMVKPEKIIVL